MKIFQFSSAAFSALLFSYVLSACSNSYSTAQTITATAKYPAAIEKAKKNHRYFIMQSGLNIYTVTSVDLDKAKQQMTVTLDKVDSSRLANTTNAVSKPYRPQKGEPAVSSRIFLYMKDSTSYTLDEPHTIPIDKVGRLELSN